MNSLLISIGAAIVIALLAAFVGPSFVDWNSYRDQLEAKAEQLLCRKVEIAGDLDVQLLPQPVLTTGKIEISGRGDEVLTSAAGTNLSLDLGVLLLGGIEVTAMELDRPVFAISTDETGVLNWAATDERANPSACEEGVAGLNFRRIGVVNGIATFKTTRMASPVTFERVDAALTSGGPSGPYKFTGAHGDADNRRGFSFSSGRIASGVSSRVSGRAALDDRTEATFDGEIEGWGAPLHYIGAVKVQRNEALGEKGNLRLSAEAKADIGAKEAGFSEVTVMAVGPKATSTFTGAARWDGGQGTPRVGLDLKARRIDVAALFGDEKAPDATQNGVVAVLQSVKDWFAASGATGRITLGVAGAQYRDELVQDFNASINLGAGSLGIESVKAILPGQSEFGFTGNLFEGETDDKLVGTLVFNTRDLKRLLDWAVPQSHKRFTELLPQTHGKLSLTGGVAAQAGALEMTGIEGLIDGGSFSGDLSFDLGLPGKLNGALAFDELDLDHLVPANFSPIDLLNGDRGGTTAANETAESAASVQPSIGLEIEARRMKWRGRELRGVAATGSYSERNLVIERLTIDYLAGSQISGDGEVEFSVDGPVGGLDFHVETNDMPALALVFGADLAKMTGRGPGWLSGIRQGSFGGRLEAQQQDENWQVGMGLRGELGGTSFTAKITSDAAPAHLASGRIEAGVKLATDNAGKLFAQIGLDALPDTTPDAAANLNFDTVGSAENGFGYSLLFTGLDVVTSAEGNVETAPARVNGRLSLTAKDSNKIADLLGVGRQAPVLPPTGLAAEFDLKGGTLEVMGVSGQLAGVDLAGEGVVQISGARSSRFDLKADHVSLPWVLMSLFGGNAANALVASSSNGDLGGGSKPFWSTDLIGTDVMDRWPIALELNASTMDIGGGFALAGAVLDASIGDGKLDLRELSGDLIQEALPPGQVGAAAGLETGSGTSENQPRFSASGQLRGTDIGVEVDGKLAANGIPLVNYLKGASGKPLLSGEVAGEAEFRASGRSLLSLASSLGGKGSLSISGAVLPRMDGRSVLAVAERSGQQTRIKSILSKSGNRAMELEISPLVLEASNGRVKIGPAPLKSKAIGGEVTGFLNLVAGRIDQEIVLNGENGISLGIIHAGPVGEMSREIEMTGLKSGGLQWRESDVVSAAPAAADTVDAVPTYGDPIAAPETGARVGAGAETSGPPVGVFDQQVFELPLAEGGGT